jgi:hypothetical protein
MHSYLHKKNLFLQKVGVTLSQDNVAIKKLLALGTRLGTVITAKDKTRCTKSHEQYTMTKLDVLHHTHFIEHLMCMIKKSQAKYKVNEENSSL